MGGALDRAITPNGGAPAGGVDRLREPLSEAELLRSRSSLFAGICMLPLIFKPVLAGR